MQEHTFGLAPTAHLFPIYWEFNFIRLREERSGLYGSNKGEPYTEMYEGFTLGYPKDKCGFLVDMLQFVWYSQVE
jgi:hypothetical protein